MPNDDLDNMLEQTLGEQTKPYRDRFPAHERIPASGVPREEILAELVAISESERAGWQDGFASGAVYHGDERHIEFLNSVYALTSQANPLHTDLWPGITKFEAETVSMTANMLGGAEAEDEICGCVSSGGTESILLAMKTYRDYARAKRGVTEPEIVAPTTAHAAFDKAAHYFGMKLVHVPVGADCRADIAATRDAIGPNTVVVVGSSPSYPHGAVDPIPELSELARGAGVPFHTDGCLGGFLLPWVKRLGRDVPDFDFRLPGVTSMSADTHKYGYSAKGTSVVLYRGRELRRFQYYKTATWSGGLYATPTFAGSRPGALSAAAWAALLENGEDGYMDAAARIMAAADAIRSGVESIPELRILGEPLWVIAFESQEVNIYHVMERMGKRGWSLNGLLNPAAIHICVTLRHTAPGVAERFVRDLRESVDEVKRDPETTGTMAPIYGMAGGVETRGAVEDILERYVDMLYRL